MSDLNYVLDDQIGYLLRLVSQRHGMIFQKHTIDNITPTQFSALLRIYENKECSQNYLGRISGMDVATVKGVVDRLVDKGFVQSRPDPVDRRRHLVSLTETGEYIIKDMAHIGKRITAETLKPLSSQEQKTLLKVLKKLI
jgi:MarR family transcriptional regulator, lower aerobic nicotinate degradation pathway regulator